MRKLWLIFAQTVTVSLAVLFSLVLVLTVLRPAWLNQITQLAPATQTSPPGNTVASFNIAPPNANLSGVDASHPPALGSYSEAAKKSLPAVVQIFTAQKVATARNPLLNDPIFQHFFGERNESAEGRPRQKAGLGSGVIVSTEGYILTNFHVIEEADQIEISLNDGRQFSAHLVGADPETDLAVLKVDADPAQAPKGPLKLPAITLGNMSNIQVGDVVLAIGNPYGVGQTLTMGIVSALNRSHLGLNTYENFIQTDAAINFGNSGGALVDSYGNLIGINTATVSRAGGTLGISFAIPISTAKNVMEEIIQTGRVTRGWIGVEAQELTPELAESFGLTTTTGALIAGVQRGSPADLGGIKPGDILLSIADQAVRNSQSMLDLIATQKPNETVSIKLRRKKNEMDVLVKVAKRPEVRRNKR